MEFQIGDKVVYPNQGVGIVEQISTRNLTGQPFVYAVLDYVILAVPSGSCEKLAGGTTFGLHGSREVPIYRRS